MDLITCPGQFCATTMSRRSGLKSSVNQGSPENLHAGQRKTSQETSGVSPISPEWQVLIIGLNVRDEKGAGPPAPRPFMKGSA
jgi:hypothetical protein